MRHVHLSFLALVVLLALATFGLAVQQDPAEQTGQRIEARFSDQGVASISTTLADDRAIEVEVRTTEFTPDSFPYAASYPNREWAGWGQARAHPRTVVTAVDVKVAGKNVWVRMSSFSDLANPSRLVFEETTARRSWPTFRLVVSGGDAGTSYSAELAFNTLFIEGRKVLLNEVPTQVREQTVYTEALIGSSAW
jgi:hypothetical protein